MNNKSARSPLLWFAVLAVLAVGGALYWRHAHLAGAGPAGGSGGGMRGAGGGPMPVQVRPVTTGDLHVYVNGLGTVTAYNSAVVHTRISGEVMRLFFHEGESVKAGQELALIDPRPYEVALTQAQGQLAKDQALLEDARVDQKRYQGLLAQDSIAAQQVDTQNALVHQYEGAVKADQGAVESARLNLLYTRVTTTASGVAGLRQIDVGNIANPSDTNGIVVVNQVQPIFVVFTVPEDSVPQLVQSRHDGDSLSVEAWDRDDKTKLASGHIQSIDNQIDTATGTLKLRAVFDNADRTLFPNQFVNAHLLLETRPKALLVPAAAVQRGSNGTFVFVVDGSQHVAMRPIGIGPQDGDNVQVLGGLRAGEVVVIDGADKLKDGGKVSVVTPAVPGAAASGAPAAAPHQGYGQHRHRSSDAAQ